MAQNTFIDSILLSVKSLFVKGEDQKALKLFKTFKDNKNKKPEQIFKIKTRQDVERAQNEWGKDNLKQLPKKRQKEFADYLLEQSRLKRVKPLNHWLKIAKDI